MRFQAQALLKSKSKNRLWLPALVFSLVVAGFFAVPQTSHAVGTLTLTQTGFRVDASATGDLITIVTYTARYTGPATPPFRIMEYVCGTGKISGPTPASSSTPGPNTFTCEFPAGASSSVTATARGPGSITLTTASVPVSISSTGAASSDSGAKDEADSGVRVYLTSLLSLLFLAIQSWLGVLYWIIIMPIIMAVGQIQTGVGSCATLDGTGMLSGLCGGIDIVTKLVYMSFILVMIFIGIASILRLQSYNYKRLLGKLIIWAFFVPFTTVIALAFLKLFDILRFTVFDPTATWKLVRFGYEMIGYHFVTLGAPDVLTAIGLKLGIEITQFPVLAIEMMNLALSFLTFFVMAAVSALMLISVVVLRVLLVLSPLWPAMVAVPMLAGLAKSWWTHFFQYGLFLPIIFFFLRIAEELTRSPIFGQITTGCQILSGPSGPGCDASMGLFNDFIFLAVQRIGVIIFVLAGLMVAQKLSIFGASAIMGLGQKAMMLPLLAGAVAGGAVAGAGMRAYSGKMGKLASAAEQAGDWKKADRYKALSLLNPFAAKKAWEERKKEKEQEAYGASTGHARDFLNRFMPTEWEIDKATGKKELGKRSKYGRIGEKATLNYKKAEFKDAQLSEEELVRAYLGARDPGDRAALRQLLIEGRHEDGLRIIEAADKRQEIETQYFQQFKAEGQTDIVARELAKNKVAEDTASGKLDAAIYDSVDDKIREHDWRLAHGMSEAQSGNAASQNAELGEAIQMKRAIGEDYYYDDKFWASASKELWNHIEKKEGSSGMLKHLADLKMEKMGVESQPVMVKDQQGNDVALTRMVKNEATGQMEEQVVTVPVKLTWHFTDKNGVEQAREITNAAEFQKVINETSKENGVSYESLGNLRYETAGALIEKSGRKRIMRGNQERWAGADEPAAYMEQDETGEFTRFTSVGRRMLINKSPAEVNSFRNSRGAQSRAMKIAGFYVNEETGDTEIRRKDIFLELYDMNKDYAKALTGKLDFDQQQAVKIVDDLNDFLRKNKILDKTGKQREFSVGAKDPRGGATIVES